MDGPLESGSVSTGFPDWQGQFFVGYVRKGSYQIHFMQHASGRRNIQLQDLQAHQKREEASLIQETAEDELGMKVLPKVHSGGSMSRLTAGHLMRRHDHTFEETARFVEQQIIPWRWPRHLTVDEDILLMAGMVGQAVLMRSTPYKKAGTKGTTPWREDLGDRVTPDFLEPESTNADRKGVGAG
ncbi:hypothetical protein SARC_09837 [Sphaeroforma arctica JP610]|uniref:Uncharacterized protein n=1 Tax=Sphaeroforma arctica JP610 TaxID=667725 RepID=A0A0L0FMJ0_9EUKA|nr:hypothetical protein SARC_09837 [Sphaeroforma arctica JP610]KNC77711.1 hypothetical protein SARC_09837 [Sphaeroforma arctica JP610]|eukprot:XP_014151613.1 hypothetical protein SARC_09837 [Sphaeroforma arctica JP610]